MTSPQYKHPPITEAVVEIRQRDSLSEKVVVKINDRLKKRYESSERLTEIGFRLDLGKKERIAELPDSFVGYKLTSKDQTDVVQIKPNSISWSRLAPYNGWEKFIPRARENWEIWRKEAKHRKLDRIGVRYLNRIDIPIKAGERVDVEDYLTVFPKYPEPRLLKSFSRYTMQIMGPSSVEGFDLIINTNVVKSPLIDHFSIVLDLDLSPQGEISEKNDQVWDVINQMREHKNDAFETCITDKARELFS